MTVLTDAVSSQTESQRPVHSRSPSRALGRAFELVRDRARTPRPADTAATEAAAAALTKRPKTGPLKLPTTTIFHEPWWLDAASDGTYEEVVVDNGGTIVGRLPYLRSRRLGWQTALVMPAMTHVLGPSIAQNLPGSQRAASLRRFTICTELLAQLPKASHIWFALSRHMTDTLAFDAAGFTAGVRFTAEIAPDPQEVLWRQMRDKTRNVIRRAEETLTVTTPTDAAGFFDFYKDNLRKRELGSNYDLRLCENVMSACLQRDRGRILAASDGAGNMQAAIFTAWDDEAEYYLMSTRAPGSHNGASSLLIWTALRAAAAAGRTFDLDGIHVHSSYTNHLLITGFGGVVKPRYTVSITSPGFQAVRALKSGLTTGLRHTVSRLGRR